MYSLPQMGRGREGFLYLNKHLILIQPVAHIPHYCPDAQTSNNFNGPLAPPGKQQTAEWRNNSANQMGASDREEEIDENAVHPDYNKHF